MDSERQALERALGHALGYLRALDRSPVAAGAALPQLRRALGRPLPERGTPAPQVVDELAADVAGGLSGSQSGRFFSWVIGGGLPSAMAADWLTTAWDQNAGIHAASPAASVVEEVAGGWLKELFGLPPEASFAFVTGTQMAHVTCLAAARHAVLARRGWNVELQGLAGAPGGRATSPSPPSIPWGGWRRGPAPPAPGPTSTPPSASGRAPARRTHIG